ncbi:hypothetical protein CFOL_v3_16366 [Cephalotus follicularis]|uniref:DUF4408 domain-containing protein n=1 Tax=Cephalotus follicularis TaxID=3775 RepID=A0A1Q3BYF1_CEPFO|nr:hypothetical protein CFOL_v3_16366 [Cephalotus follicularis]
MGSFDNFMDEKAEAMRRYNRKQKFKFLLHAFASLALLFWSSKWIIETGPNCLLDVTNNLSKPVFPFLIVHFLIFIIFILSTYKKPQQHPESSNENVINAACYLDKQIVCSSSPKEKDTETILCPVQSETVSTVDALTEAKDEKGKEMVVVELEPEKTPSVHDKMSDVEFNVVVSTYIYKQIEAWSQEHVARKSKLS